MEGGQKRPSLRRWILLAVVVLALVAFVLPPLVNLNRYQHRIAENIGRSIGRQVHISSVKLRLLPLPGLEFSDFSVREDPQFGAEPILHSGSVVAYLRILSLWRGRLEVSRIHFDDASLNLVRQPNGGWNLASILIQAAHIPNAPTGQRYAGSAPRFPYIEAENARINFKQGNEKMPLSFLNSDLSISLDQDNDWELHLKAQPVRTDLNISLADTGMLRIDGMLHRAAMLREMPLKLKVEWSGVPLGQLSRLTLGHDIDWRGGLNVESEVSGTANLAQIPRPLEDRRPASLRIFRGSPAGRRRLLPGFIPERREFAGRGVLCFSHRRWRVAAHRRRTGSTNRPSGESEAGDSPRPRRSRAQRTAGSAKQSGRRSAGHRSAQRPFLFQLTKGPSVSDCGRNGARLAKLDPARFHPAVRSGPR